MRPPGILIIWGWYIAIIVVPIAPLLLVLFICISIIFLNTISIYMNNQKWVKWTTVISAIALIVAIATLMFVVLQLNVMNDTLDSQLGQSERIADLTEQELEENRKDDFDRNTDGAVYVWGLKPLNEDETVWAENLTVLFSNQFRYSTLNNLVFHIKLPERDYCNYSNYSVKPRLGAALKNGTIEPPHNETIIEWKTINVATNATVTFRVVWNKELLPLQNITPIKNDISVSVRGDDYSVVNLPVRYGKPPGV
jgi:hypothetical protein